MERPWIWSTARDYTRVCEGYGRQREIRLASVMEGRKEEREREWLLCVYVVERSYVGSDGEGDAREYAENIERVFRHLSASSENLKMPKKKKRHVFT